MARPPAGGVATTTALTGSDQGVLTGGGVFYGGCFYETGADTATATIHDGTAASGTVIAYISLASGGVTNLSIPNGVQVLNGIYVDVGGSGTVAGSIFSTS
jgi:hypothetical protein